MFSSLSGKAKEAEEDKGAERPRPTVELDPDNDPTIRMPYDGGKESDTTEIVVGVAPADPLTKWLGIRVDSHLEDGERSSAHQFDTGKGHQTEVSAHSQRGV